MTLKPKPTDAELKNILAEHWKWLSNQNLSKRADFSDTDLVGVDLTNANLRYANLVCAYLIDANLVCADLANVDFSNANLAIADLSGACLTCANLRNANLSGANLTGANLTGTNLRDADLTGSAGGDFTQTNGIYYIGGLQYERGILINPTNTPFYTPAVQQNPAIQSIPTAKAINVCQCPIRDLMTSGHNSHCVERK